MGLIRKLVDAVKCPHPKEDEEEGQAEAERTVDITPIFCGRCGKFLRNKVEAARGDAW
jgi:hypothetical protein